MSIGSAIRAINAASKSALPIPWTRATKPDGYVYATPLARQMAQQSGFDFDTLALAANVQSEVGSLPAQYKYAVAEVAINESVATGKSIGSLLVDSGKAPGYFGQQSGRWAATTQKPTYQALEAARQAKMKTAPSFTRGARRYLDLKVHDGGTQAGKPIMSAEAIISSRYNDGWKWIGPVHDPDSGEWLIDSYILFLMSRDGKYSRDDAMAELANGRARWKSGGVVANIAPRTGAGIILIAGAALALVREVF